MARRSRQKNIFSNSNGPRYDKGFGSSRRGSHAFQKSQASRSKGGSSYGAGSPGKGASLRGASSSRRRSTANPLASSTSNSMKAADIRRVARAHGAAKYSVTSQSSRHSSYRSVEPSAREASSSRRAAHVARDIRYITPDVATGEDMGDCDRVIALDGYSHGGLKRFRRKRIIHGLSIGIAALVVALILAVFTYTAVLNGRLHSGFDKGDLAAVLSTPASAEDPYFMLLLGLDGPASGEETAADAIILAAVNPQTQGIALVSFHRDTPVYVEGHGYMKLSDAYTSGGAPLMVSSVAELAGVSINHYASVDCERFIKLVDKLGGVEMDVALNVTAKDLDGNALDQGAADIASGEQLLGGAQALTFCRSAYYANESYQTAANQRVFLEAAAQAFLTSNYESVFKKADAMSSCISSDFSLRDVRNFIRTMQGITVEDFYQYACPVTEYYDSGGRYLAGETLQIPVSADLTALMEEIVQGDYPAVSTSEHYGGTVAEAYLNANAIVTSGDYSGLSITVNNGSGANGVAAAATKALKTAGLTVTTTGNAAAQVYEETLVVYNKDSQLEACTAIVNALGVGRAVPNGGRYTFTTDILVVLGSDYSG